MSRDEKNVMKKENGEIEGFPFAVVYTDEDFNVLEENRLAKKLLPPPWKLRRFLKSFKGEGGKKTLFVTRWENVRYLVAILKRECGFWVAFMEDITDLRESVSHSLWEEGLSFFDAWDERCERFSCENSRALVDALAARTNRFRRSLEEMQNGWKLPEKSLSAPALCPLKEFFSFLGEKLKLYRVNLSYSGGNRDAAFVSSELLVLLILHLIRFLLVYEKERVLSVRSQKTKGTVHLICKFPDGEGLFDAFFTLFDEKILSGEILPSLGLLPLITLILLCRKHEVKMKFFTEDGEGVVRFSFPSGSAVSDAFLETDSDEEKERLEGWIERILFGRK